MVLFQKRNLLLVMGLLTIIQSTDGFYNINHRLKAGNRQTGLAYKTDKSTTEKPTKNNAGAPVEKFNATSKKNNQKNTVTTKSAMNTINATSIKDNQEYSEPKSELMKAMIDRLNHLEDNVSTLNNKTKDQANEIDSLKKSAVKTNEKHENEINSLKDQVIRLESKINILSNKENSSVGVIKDPSLKREKRQSSNTTPIPTCRKEACAFDVSIRSNKNTNVSAKIESSTESNTNIATVELPVGSKKPTSCADLALLGHKNNGFYLVQGRQDDSILPNRIESVYCDFSNIQANSNMLQSSSKRKNGVREKRIGFVNVKSSLGVYFYFGRKTGHSMSNNKGVVLFDREILNVGEAMSNSSIFTAPVSGTYHFSFSAVRSQAAFLLAVHLRVNENPVAEAYTSIPNPSDHYFSMGLQATLKLNAGDQVDIYKDKNVIFKDDESGLRLTHFTGWLLEETLQDI